MFVNYTESNSMRFEKWITNPESKKQHNIMCLVGNGFDTAIFNKYVSGIPNKKSSYSDFYDYITFHGLLNMANDAENTGKLIDEKTRNIIYNKMKGDKNTYEKRLKNYEKHKKEAEEKHIELTNREPELNWCDFEKSIDELIFDDTVRTQYINQYNDELVSTLKQSNKKVSDENIELAYYKRINNDLIVMRDNFSRFINDLLSSDIIINLNKDARNYKWAYQSLQNFLEDLKNSDNIKNLEFPHKCQNAHLMNFGFFCFNYTTLLDNYICLDQGQFDPHTYKDADTNFIFNADPNGMFSVDHENNDNSNKKDRFLSVYLLADIIHPHGIKDVPRSMLFGTENPKYNVKEYNKNFVKSYWGQNNRKYLKDFQETELFIIYGMSLGSSDGWWMGNVYKRLLGHNSKDSETDNKAELIIYFFSKDELDNAAEIEYQNKIKENFCNACVFYDEDKIKYSKSKRVKKYNELVKSRIYVVILHDNNNSFLGFNKTTTPTYNY